jgi:ribonuclease VapC
LIVVDSSPLIAILRKEVDAEQFYDVLRGAGQLSMTAPSKLEVMMVASGRIRSAGPRLAQALIDNMRIDIIPFTESLTDVAATAFMRYGKGQNHPAKLNFGDCIAYALAKSSDVPLLYKGGDFALTDIRSAL